MPRPRASSEQLRLAGAQKSKIAARLREEQDQGGPLVADNEAKARWMPYLKEAIAREKQTFAQRRIPGQTVCLDLGNRQFNWYEQHPLTMARMYAEQTLVIPESKAALPILREECSQFLAELETGHEQGFFLDPVAANALELIFNTFDRRGWECGGLALFDFVQFVGWKKSDGSLRFGPEDWLYYKHRNVLAQGIKLSESLTRTT